MLRQVSTPTARPACNSTTIAALVSQRRRVSRSANTVPELSDIAKSKTTSKASIRAPRFHVPRRDSLRFVL
jgi:hypothetical protein